MFSLSLLEGNLLGYLLQACCLPNYDKSALVFKQLKVFSLEYKPEYELVM